MNGFVSRHLPWFVLGCISLGLLFSDIFSQLGFLSTYLFSFMTFTNSLSGDFRDLARVGRHPLPALTIILLLHVGMPLLTLVIGNLLFPDSPLFTLGLLLEYSIPTAVSSLMWVGVGGGDMALCLAVVLLDTLLAPFVVPLSMRIFSGSVVELDAVSMMVDLLFMVAIPALIAMSLHQGTHGRVETSLKPKLDPFAKLCLLLIISINASGCAPYLKNINRTLVLVIISVFGLCLLGYFLGYVAGRLLHLPFPTVMTMSLNTGARNISAGAVLASQYFPPDVMFPVAFSPLFFQLTTSLIVKLLLRTKVGRAWRAAQQETAAPK